MVGRSVSGRCRMIAAIAIAMGLSACVLAHDGWGPNDRSGAVWIAGDRPVRSMAEEPLWLFPIADHFGVSAQPRASYGFPGTAQGHLELEHDVDAVDGLPAPDGWSHRFPFVEFRHGNPDDPGRHVGKGNPLEGTSWLNRPWHVGFFLGALYGDDVIDRQEIGRAHV